MNRKLVVVESPYRGNGYASLELNLVYARACMRDCFLRGEFPFASHLLYTQDGVLDDKNPDERRLGMSGGWAWAKYASLSAVYIDLIDDWKHFIGVAQGVFRANHEGRAVEFRNLHDWVLDAIDPEIFPRRRDPAMLVKELQPFIESNRSEWERILFS